MSAPNAVQAPETNPPSPFTFDPVEDAIRAIADGQFVVVMDDESRENEGDLVCAASKVTVEGMAWMIRATSGFICISMPPERLRELQLPPLLPASGTSQDPKGTAYHLTIDTNPCPTSSSSAPSFRGFPSSASQPPPLVPDSTSSEAASNPTHPVSTGISAHDRAYTARLLADGAGPEHFTRPGHMVPLRYTLGGVTKRRGHTECAVDLCYLADLPPAGLLCELVHPSDPLGSMARRDDCWRFAKQWGLKIISVEDLADYVGRKGTGAVPGAEVAQ